MNADLIIKNATIHTMDDNRPKADQIAVKDGKIIAFDQEAALLQGEETEVIDADGRVVLPGIIESHAHPLHYANNLLQLDLRTETAPSITDILEAVSKRAQEIPEGEWILGMGWDDSKLKEKRFPSFEELSEAAPHHPVFLKRTCVHNAVANRKAFEASGISEDPVDPDGGHFHRNSDGTVSGLIQENAMMEFAIPSVTINQLKDAMREAQEHFFQWGITTIHDMAVSKKELTVYQELCKEGGFPLKVRMWLWGIDQMGWQGVEEEALALGLQSGLGDDHLNIQGLKYMLDGSVGGRTAALAEPFVDDGDNRGILYMPQEKINKHVSRAVANGMRVSIHGIGERAVEMALQAIEQAAPLDENKKHRHRIEHCALPSEEQLERIASQEIVAGSSIGFIYAIGDSYWNNLGEERARRVFPHASFRKHGIVSPGNSDMPVCPGNPFFGMYAAVTRTTVGGQQLGTEETIPVEEAVKAYTADAAYSGFDDTIIGTLSEGKYADIVILEDNPFTIPEEKIKDIQVSQTIVEGETVYKRENS
ncbi:amidohydrolase [Alteribacillus iranensis]|uniref:Amidohydrolase 3 domain-containing protein n=1 Tax=Alteribacillus iranensis TaxID=930128 RepID=A0A1I2C6W0_9BACI|nr:amidohydrolase [Alteribacillus iranensis]SFE63882.1 hypothetical protein SAMN05192532_102742 [Alteribacillus iranensis]